MTLKTSSKLAFAAVVLAGLAGCVTSAPAPAPQTPVVVQTPAPAQPSVVVTPRSY